MVIKRFAISMIIVLGLLAKTSWSETFTGNMSYGNGLTGAAIWSSAELTWTVDNVTNPGLWTYTYTFTVDAKDISYVLTGVWKSFTSESMNHGTTASCELGTFCQQGKSAPGIPGDIYGLKCTPKRSSPTYSWSIVTDRSPRWNSFYAKSGKHKGNWVFAYNTGFGTEPSNSTVADGNNGGWVLAPGMTFHEQTVNDFAIDRFEHIRSIVAPEDETKPEAEFIGHHIEVSSEKWVYVMDDSGQQIFRPKAMYPHIEPSLSEDITPYLDEWMVMTVPQSTVDEAKSIALAALFVNYMGDVTVNVFTKRELIALKNLDLDTPLTHHEGRTKVLLNPETSNDLMVKKIKTQFTHNPINGLPIIRTEEIYMPPRSHETAITFAQEKVVRIDSVFVSQDDQAVVDFFRDGLMNGHIQAFYPQIYPMVLGTFFQPSEWRFPFAAHAWESEDFITTSEPYDNPYGTVEFPFCPDDPTALAFFPFFRLTTDYKGDYWHHWNLYGRTNGVRGNCKVLQWPSQTCKEWEYGSWVIRHHNLGDYQWICPPLHFCARPDSVWPDDYYREPWGYCLDVHAIYKCGSGYILEDAFYDDMEDCHLAIILAHGGGAFGIQNYNFQVKRDIWAYVHTEGLDGLGKGKLRHLFLESCSSMNWHKEEPYYIETSWLNNHVAEGIRSIFGTDGGYDGTHCNGLVFFDYYNNGDSILDSWANMEINVGEDNIPVGIGYGNNPFDALASLLDHRFSWKRAGNSYAVAIALLNVANLTQ